MDRDVIMDEIKKLQKDNGGIWGQHDIYVRCDWEAEVSLGDTQLGYWEWVLHKIEDNKS